MLQFKIWLEQQELMDDPVSQAILGVVAEDQALGDAEAEHLLSRNTTDFSNEIQDNLKNLGIIKNLSSEDPERYNGILDAIEQGISIRDLIEKAQGKDYAPNADIKVDTDPKLSPQQDQPMYIQPPGV